MFIYLLAIASQENPKLNKTNLVTRGEEASLISPPWLMCVSCDCGCSPDTPYPRFKQIDSVDHLKPDLIHYEFYNRFTNYHYYIIQYRKHIYPPFNSYLRII